MFYKYKVIAGQSLSFVDMKSGVMPRILLWKSIQGSNPTKSVAANKDVLFPALQFIRNEQVSFQ